MSRVEEGLRLALAFAEAFNRHDVAAIDAIISDDCLFESAGPAPVGLCHRGRAATTQAIGEFFTTTPHLEMLVEEAYGLGKRAILRWRLLGLAGLPEGRRGVDLFKARDGRIVEILAYAKG